MRFQIISALAFSALFSGGSALAQTDELASLESWLDTVESSEQTLVRARELGEAGDLTGAATVLERFLLVNPDDTPVRVAYVANLCDLDDIQAATFEMMKLAKSPLDASQQARVASACPAEVVSAQTSMGGM